VDGKFVQIGVEFVGEEQKTYSSVDIYEIRFLKPKVIDRIIVQLRLEVKVGNLVWTIQRSLEDFRLLKDSFTLPADFSTGFPDTDQRYFPDDTEIIKIRKQVSEWLLEALKVQIRDPLMLVFLGVMEAELTETTNTRLDMDTLIKTCETGDILLFRTHGIIPSSIRRLSNSKYDHVGVIVVREHECGGRKTCFLEASGDRYGVYLHSLRTRLREWFSAGARISYRRLRCLRGTRFDVRTNNFIEKVQGLKYGWSLKNLMLNTKDQ